MSNEKQVMLIKEIARKKGWSMTFLASQIGLKASYFTDVKNNKTSISKERLEKIAKLLGTSVDYLLGNTENQTIIQAEPIDLGEFVSIELLSNIKAGYNGLAIADVQEMIAIPKIMIHGYPVNECKVFRIKGNSMYPKYENGDYIVVHVQSSVDSGDTAVIVYDGDEATVKKLRFVYGEDWLEMIPINPEYMTKRIEGAELSQCCVYGKVISMFRV